MEEERDCFNCIRMFVISDLIEFNIFKKKLMTIFFKNNVIIHKFQNGVQSEEKTFFLTEYIKM